jgi:hypothetical protein
MTNQTLYRLVKLVTLTLMTIFLDLHYYKDYLDNCSITNQNIYRLIKLVTLIVMTINFFLNYVINV